MRKLTIVERLGFARTQLAAMIPDIEEELEVGMTSCWDEDPWARGTIAFLRPGQFTTLYPHIARPEDRLHFAGEHTSPWNAWMQGALDSGMRVVQEIGTGTSLFDCGYQETTVSMA